MELGSAGWAGSRREPATGPASTRDQPGIGDIVGECSPRFPSGRVSPGVRDPSLDLGPRRPASGVAVVRGKPPLEIGGEANAFLGQLRGASSPSTWQGADLLRRLRPTRTTTRRLRLFCYSATVSYVLTMTDRGVVTLPAKLRRELGLAPNQPLLAEVTGDGVLLRPAATLPIEIYSAERIEEFDQAEADLARVLAQEGS